VSSRSYKILVYSHDSYGLGHLRRCRAIAQSLAERRANLSILIIAGSPLVGSFSFHPQVDFIRVPGVVKLGNEHYEPHSPGLSIESLTEIRSAIIAETARVFEPDLFLVDKEPLGLRGEVEHALHLLKSRGCHLVLGLRDVMDEPKRLLEEWTRKRAFPALEELYDHIWVYGLKEIWDPLSGLNLSDAVQEKVRFTGYLRRALTPALLPSQSFHQSNEPYLLVTTGGGADGDLLVDSVLKAYEADPSLDVKTKIVLGPLMEASDQKAFLERVRRLKQLQAITFDANIECLIEKAEGVISMGGYNTFCEILSFDKRALIVPRTVPRAEQYIRASRAAALGLVSAVKPLQSRDPSVMGLAIRALFHRAKPSQVRIAGLLEGLSEIGLQVDQCLACPPGEAVGVPRLTVVARN
jgi:predicted glycosyltransferase